MISQKVLKIASGLSVIFAGCLGVWWYAWASEVPGNPGNPCNFYLGASGSDAPMHVFYKDVCYLGRQSIDPFKYSDFIFLGFKETERSVPSFPVIGIDQSKPVAAIVDDRTVQEIQGALPQEGANKLAPVPFMLAVVAIDAGLIGTMWAVAVSASLD